MLMVPFVHAIFSWLLLLEVYHAMLSWLLVLEVYHAQLKQRKKIIRQFPRLPNFQILKVAVFDWQASACSK